MLLDSCKRELVLDAFRSGAKGIFSKNDSLETLCKCVLSVHEGQVWASSREVRYVLEALCAAPTIRAVNKQGMSLLAPRELEVVQCLAEGLTNREIGKRMGLSQHTVKNYLLRIFDKLGVSNRVELLSLTMSHQSPAPQPRRDAPDTPPLLWCHYAAERGVPYAQLLLADLLVEGKSLPRDLVAACMWYQVSEAMSGAVRQKIHAARMDLLRNLTPEQAEQARAKAEEWLRRNAATEVDRPKPHLKPPRTSDPDQRLAVGS
jgi:DNA-binding CsgD family transcriptional regulator